MIANRSGLHLLGADPQSAPTATSGSKTDYSPYVQAAEGLARGIAEGLKSQPPPPPPPPSEESDAAWYVAGAAAVAVVVALLLRARG
jgi:hypothetical protein